MITHDRRAALAVPVELISYHRYLLRRFPRPLERLIRVHAVEIPTQGPTVSIDTSALNAELSRSLNVRCVTRSRSTGKYSCNLKF
jgi:hypothetical protein